MSLVTIPVPWIVWACSLNFSNVLSQTRLSPNLLCQRLKVGRRWLKASRAAWHNIFPKTAVDSRWPAIPTNIFFLQELQFVAELEISG